MKTKKRILFIICVLAVIAMQLVCFAADNNPSNDVEVIATGRILGEESERMLNLINEYRESKGLNRLVPDYYIQQDAIERAFEASSTNLAHTRPNDKMSLENFYDIKSPGLPAVKRFCKENLGYDAFGADSCVEGWKKDSHNAAMLAPDIKSAGTAVVQCEGAPVYVFLASEEEATGRAPEQYGYQRTIERKIKLEPDVLQQFRYGANIVVGKSREDNIIVGYGKNLALLTLPRQPGITLSTDSDKVHIDPSTWAITGRHVGDFNVTMTVGGSSYTNTFKCLPGDSSEVKATLEYTSVYETGSELKPAVKLTAGGVEIAASNYTVTYSNNVAPGTASVRIEGTAGADYRIGHTLRFTIKARTDIKNCSFSKLQPEYQWKGVPVVLDNEVKITDFGTTLKQDTDYKISYLNNAGIGKATMTITGIGAYKGTINITFDIVKERVEPTIPTPINPGSDPQPQAKISLKGATLTVNSSYYWTGYEVRPVPVVTLAGKKLTYGIDYICSWPSASKNVGTYTMSVKGIGEYGDEAYATYRVVKKNLSSSTVTLSATKFYYTGKDIKPSVTVKYNGATLRAGTDYTVTYSNNKAAGTGKVKVTGTGSYAGEKTASFTIVKKAALTVTVSKKTVTYNGKTQKPSIVVKDQDGKTLKSSQYSVSYSNNKNCGTAKVTVKGKSGTTNGLVASSTFVITPKKVSIKSPKREKTAITAKWSKTSCTQYQVQISKNKKFSDVTTYVVKGTSKKLGGLSRKTYYYIRVRAMLKTGGKDYYGSWSSVKKVKTK